MWVLPEFNENDLFSIIRETGGDLIEAVNLVDVFVDKLSKRTSKAYRINFQSL
jgi:phenylalanyl-tRNA synthetase alpha chain